jgi:hypothetical protein
LIFTQEYYAITSVIDHNMQKACCWNTPPSMFQAQNKSNLNLKLIIAPDPNQLEWVEGGLRVEGGIQGGGVGMNFGKTFRPKDERVQKRDLLLDNGKSWKSFRMQTNTVFITVLRHDNETLIGEENIKVSRGDQICFQHMDC